MRLTHRPDAESAYNIFYQFLAGVDSTVRYIVIHYHIIKLYLAMYEQLCPPVISGNYVITAHCHR